MENKYTELCIFYCKILFYGYLVLEYQTLKGVLGMYVENLHLQLTRNCTLECEHCLRGDRERVNMNPAVLDEIFKDVKKVGFLLLTGGEPLLAIQTLEHLAHLLKTKQVRVNKIILITNGTVLSDRVLSVLHDLQDNSYLVLKLSTDIFHNLELEKRGMLELRERNLKILSDNNFYNFSEYGKDEISNWPSALTNKGRTKTLTPERLEEINAIAKQRHIINTEFEEHHPLTSINNNKVEGNITIDVYGNVVSYGLSFEEEDKEAYDNGLNVMVMPCEEAIRSFVKRHQEEVNKVYKRLGIDFGTAE